MSLEMTKTFRKIPSKKESEELKDQSQKKKRLRELFETEFLEELDNYERGVDRSEDRQ